MYYFKEYSHYLLRRLIRKHRVGGTLLEVGCGRGENLVFLARLGFDGAGIDLSQSALEHARHRLAAEASRIVLLQRDLFAMEGAFNLVVALDVLE
ncbi:MAG TPA: class I SAM-dependent methyltransferase, partial [Gemmataceae bacterium]|nr:class I SAM-dependent methyltransferase [Gemmataceae bacterium]